MRVAKNARGGGSINGLADIMKLVIAVVFTLTFALLNITEPQPHILNVQPEVAHATEAKGNIENAKESTETPAATTVSETPKESVAVVKESIPVAQPVAQPATCQSEIAKYDWVQSTALAISFAESGYDPNTLNDNPATLDYSIGCFQINIYGANARTRPSEAELKDPVVNVAFAYKLYASNGHSFIGQWGVCRAKVQCY